MSTIDADPRIADLAFGAGDDLSALRDTLDAVHDAAQAYVVTLRVGPGAEGEPSDLRWLELFELPIVAFFEEPLSGTSAAVALACDIRVCGDRARLAGPPTSQARLRRLLRDEQALAKALAGASFTAAEALECGLVTAVRPAGEAAEEALRLAGVMATRGPIALRLGKEAIWRGLEMPLEQALRFETDLTLLLQTTKDRAEGVRAFIEKREPRFRGD